MANGDPKIIKAEIPESRRAELERLATESGKTLEEFLSEHIAQAINDGSFIAFVKERLDGNGPALSS